MILEFLDKLRWLDGTPMLANVEPYRERIFTAFFDECREDGAPRYNLGLFGRAKKNWKSADLVLACLYALLTDSPGGNQVYLVANDMDQAKDDLQGWSRPGVDFDEEQQAIQKAERELAHPQQPGKRRGKGRR